MGRVSGKGHNLIINWINFNLLLLPCDLSLHVPIHRGRSKPTKPMQEINNTKNNFKTRDVIIMTGLMLVLYLSIYTLR